MPSTEPQTDINAEVQAKAKDFFESGKEIDLSWIEFHEDPRSPNFISSALFEGKLSLEVSHEGRKQKVIARNGIGILAMDVFNLSENAKRAAFVNNLKEHFNDEEIITVRRELLLLADNLPDAPLTKACEIKSIRTSFQMLKDGRVIEQIRAGQVVYDPRDDSHSIVDRIEDSDGTIYIPEIDELLTNEGGLCLADDLADYGNEADLDADIESYLQKYVDISDLHRKMTAKYIRFTYLFDKTYELPYITATGDGGNGKTRLGELICLTSRRGLSLINPSAPNLFRIIDKYQPTLFLDELNLADTGEDTLAILQVLNSGIKKNGFVPRQEKGADGNFQTKLFKTFSPKIIGSLKKTNSQPFNSRCIEIEMEATKRNDIPFRTTSQMLEEARQLRNKLILYRLRNISADFEARIGKAENEMKAARLRPRTIQVNTPLLALTDNPELKAEFIELLHHADSVRISDKLDTLDGEIAQAIYQLLFGINGDAIISFVHGEICQELLVESVTEIINADRKEKGKFGNARMGQLLKNLKIRTKKIKSRTSAHRDKKAIIFDCETLRKLFEKFSLSPFPDFACPQCPQNYNLSIVNNLSRDKPTDNEIPLSPDKLNYYGGYEVGIGGDKEFLENVLKGNINPISAICSKCGSTMNLIENGLMRHCPLGCESRKAE